MIKKLFIACLLIIISKFSSAQESQKIQSKIKQVTVFLTGAQITRTATANINPGNSTLVFEGLSPEIDAQSIQVKAGGDFTIMNVKSERDYITQQVKGKELQENLDGQKILQIKIAEQNDLLNIAKNEEEILNKNQVVSGANTNLDVLKLKQALDFQSLRLREIKARERTISQTIADLNKELERYRRQLNNDRDKLKPTGNITVNISAKSACSTQFTLTYVVNAASWFPTYDIRAKDVYSPLTLAYKANVSQKTGENWNNIKLTLSTGDPSTNGTKPTLNPYYINFGTDYGSTSNNITKVTGRVTASDDGQPLVGLAVRVKNTTIGTTTDQNGNYSISLPSPNVSLVFSYVGYESVERKVNSSVINIAMKPSAQMLNEVVVSNALQGRAAGINVTGTPGSSPKIYIRGASTIPLQVDQDENQINVEFKINEPYTIPDDGKQTMVEISKTDLPAMFEYYSAPKITPDVFLTAQLTDWHKYNLLSGEANVFFEDTFIGKSLIDTRNASDTLNLSMGADKNIVVSRTLNKDYAEKQGLLGGKRKDTRDWLISIKNRKNQPINLLLEDQVPVSQNSAIEVETQELSGGKLDTATGKVTWMLKLSAQQEKKLNLKYQVRYSKDQPVIVH